MQKAAMIEIKSFEWVVLQYKPLPHHHSLQALT